MYLNILQFIFVTFLNTNESILKNRKRLVMQLISCCNLLIESGSQGIFKKMQLQRSL